MESVVDLLGSHFFCFVAAGIIAAVVIVTRVIPGVSSTIGPVSSIRAVGWWVLNLSRQDREDVIHLHVYCLIAGVHLEGHVSRSVVIRSELYALHHAKQNVPVIGQRLHLLSNQATGGRDPLTLLHRFQRLTQLIGRTDLADLADLLQHFRVLHRIERILVLQFGDHQLQKVIHVQLTQVGWLLGS